MAFNYSEYLVRSLNKPFLSYIRKTL